MRSSFTAPSRISIALTSLAAQETHGRPSVFSKIWITVCAVWTVWRFRARSRRDLESLDARLLEDIGVSRPLASREAAKPFWRG